MTQDTNVPELDEETRAALAIEKEVPAISPHRRQKIRAGLALAVGLRHAPSGATSFAPAIGARWAVRAALIVCGLAAGFVLGRLTLPDPAEPSQRFDRPSGSPSVSTAPRDAVSNGSASSDQVSARDSKAALPVSPAAVGSTDGRTQRTEELLRHTNKADAGPSEGRKTDRKGESPTAGVDHASLAAERELLDVVRAAVLRRNGSGALDALTSYRRDFASGLLREDADALEVQGLVLAGRYEEARQKGAVFGHRYPHSLMLGAVTRSLHSIPATE